MPNAPSFYATELMSPCSIQNGVGGAFTAARRSVGLHHGPCLHVAGRLSNAARVERTARQSRPTPVKTVGDVEARSRVASVDAVISHAHEQPTTPSTSRSSGVRSHEKSRPISRRNSATAIRRIDPLSTGSGTSQDTLFRNVFLFQFSPIPL